MFILFSELGDKTQILVLSFSARNKTTNILLGVALGTLLSHGLAIAFGSQISAINNDAFIGHLKIFTYFSFLIMGFTGLLRTKKSGSVAKSTVTNKANILLFL